MLRALTFDCWDTLYEGRAAERVAGTGAVDDALLMLPPAMLPGAWPMLRTLARRLTLAVVGDTGLASARAQDRLLEKDAARRLFAATIYLAGPARFAEALARLDVPAGEIIHVGDDERTDVRGALDAGFRAVRLDVVRSAGPSEAEFVARSFEELTRYVEGQL